LWIVVDLSGVDEVIGTGSVINAMHTRTAMTGFSISKKANRLRT